jgi:membrane protease YdiL (CAAX protease family)
MHQVDVRYTEPLVREAVNAFYWRTLRQRFGWSGWVALVVTLVAFGVLVLGGDRSWVVGSAAPAFCSFC